uniref:Uncharacterized protein n=1 Tax=Ditylenchus dipsaci TaxID=166011 RepID=A0A915D4P4_9BILA
MTQLPGCVEDLNLSEQKLVESLSGFDSRTRQLNICIEPTEDSSQGILETFHLSGDNDKDQLHAFLHVLEQAKMAHCRTSKSTVSSR